MQGRREARVGIQRHETAYWGFRWWLDAPTTPKRRNLYPIALLATSTMGAQHHIIAVACECKTAVSLAGSAADDVQPRWGWEQAFCNMIHGDGRGPETEPAVQGMPVELGKDAPSSVPRGEREFGGSFLTPQGLGFPFASSASRALRTGLLSLCLNTARPPGVGASYLPSCDGPAQALGSSDSLVCIAQRGMGLSRASLGNLGGAIFAGLLSSFSLMISPWRCIEEGLKSREIRVEGKNEMDCARD